MKLPRNLSGEQLINALNHMGYQTTRQTGSHVRLSGKFPEEHPLAVPLHDPLRVGTLAAILSDVATHHGVTRDALATKLFGRS
ncbi:MAG: type II toxin-antitoxin system HicA family toxin [Nitrosomonadales bacterium]|nr:type II toxin-antitoxin system HicA family toxin [Nitrosomonadales bacterium]